MGNFCARHTITRFCMSALVSWYQILHFLHPHAIRRFKLIKLRFFASEQDFSGSRLCQLLVERTTYHLNPLTFIFPNFSLLSPTSHANQQHKYSSLLPATLTYNLHSTIFFVCPPSLSFYSIHTMAIFYDVVVSGETITTCCDDWDGITKFLSLFFTPTAFMNEML